MATKKKANHSMNAPTKTIWIASLMGQVFAAIFFVMGLTGMGWAAIAGPVLAILSGALLLIATWVKGL